MKRNILLLFTFFACITVQGQTPVRLVDLRSEHLDRPIGLDNPVPRLSWRMEDGRQGAVQTSWRIVVDEDSLNVVNGCGRMWDSGKNDSRNQLVAYAGKKLQPFTRYYWKVICSDMEYKETASPVSYFETGMMGMQHWQGAWIGDGKDIHYGPAPYFRKEFKTGKKVKSARAYIAAAGLYELYINGEKIGDHCLAPLYTRFDRRNLYVAYDVTSQLQNGDNAIGVLLGNGCITINPKQCGTSTVPLGATVPLSVWTCALPTPMEAWRLFPPISVGGQRRVQSLLIVSILASTTMHVWSRKDGALRNSMIPSGAE